MDQMVTVITFKRFIISHFLTKAKKQRFALFTLSSSLYILDLSQVLSDHTMREYCLWLKTIRFSYGIAARIMYELDIGMLLTLWILNTSDNSFVYFQISHSLSPVPSFKKRGKVGNALNEKKLVQYVAPPSSLFQTVQC